MKYKLSSEQSSLEHIIFKQKFTHEKITFTGSYRINSLQTH